MIRLLSNSNDSENPDAHLPNISPRESYEFDIAFQLEKLPLENRTKINKALIKWLLQTPHETMRSVIQTFNPSLNLYIPEENEKDDEEVKRKSIELFQKYLKNVPDDVMRQMVDRHNDCIRQSRIISSVNVRYLYDVYISVNEDSEEDCKIAMDLRVFLQSESFKVSLQISLEPGNNKLEQYCNEINKCRKILPILSNSFLESSKKEAADECYFQIMYIQSLDPTARNNRIIPVIAHKDCQVPITLKHLNLCNWYDFTPWTKQKLINSLKV